MNTREDPLAIEVHSPALFLYPSREVALSSQVKGSAITARIKYVRDLHGEPGVRHVKDALTPAHRAILDGRVLPHAWVPFAFFVDLCENIDRIYGRGDLSLVKEVGRFAARANLPTLYRIFYVLGSPEFILGRAPRLWDVHYDSGRLETSFSIKDGRRVASIKIMDFETPHRVHCLSVAGWAEQSVELSGGKAVEVIEASCRAKGDKTCELVASWKP